MTQYERSRRVGCTAVLCAVLLRLFAADAFSRAAAFLTKPDTLAFLIYLETGRDVRSSLYAPDLLHYPAESAPAVPRPPRQPEPEPIPEAPEEPAMVVPELPTNGAAIPVSYACSLRPDLQALLDAPLPWALSPGGPAVLILSTHTTESYTKAGEDYSESSPYRTLDENYNMLSLGSLVAARLEAAGIGVIRDDSLHDYPSYTGAYSHARKSIQACLAAYPTIRLVLDLHRDAADSGGGQLRTAASIAGEPGAQLMLVVGTNASGLKHDDWQENLSLALKLRQILEELSPGITRPLNLRSQRFNQDLAPGALLVEIGAAGNTHGEALRAAEVLSDGIISLLAGQAG